MSKDNETNSDYPDDSPERGQAGGQGGESLGSGGGSHDPQSYAQDDLQSFFRDLSSLDDYKASPSATEPPNPPQDAPSDNFPSANFPSANFPSDAPSVFDADFLPPPPVTPPVTPMPAQASAYPEQHSYSGNITAPYKTVEPFYRKKRLSLRWLGWVLLGLVAIASGMFAVNYLNQKIDRPIFEASAISASLGQIRAAAKGASLWGYGLLENVGNWFANEPIPWLVQKVSLADIEKLKSVTETKSVVKPKVVKRVAKPKVVTPKVVKPKVVKRVAKPKVVTPKVVKPKVVKRVAKPKVVTPKVVKRVAKPVAKPKVVKPKVFVPPIIPKAPIVEKPSVEKPIEEIVPNLSEEEIAETIIEADPPTNELAEEEVAETEISAEELSPAELPPEELSPAELPPEELPDFIQANSDISPFSFVLPASSMPQGKYIVQAATCRHEQCLQSFATVLRSLDIQPFFRLQIEKIQVLEVLSREAFPSEEISRAVADFVNQNNLPTKALPALKNNQWRVSLGQQVELKEAQALRSMVNRVSAPEATFQIQVQNLAEKTYQVLLGPFQSRMLAEESIQVLKTQNTKFSAAVVDIQ